ncbi:MAG: transcriptional repressor LexA [Clostridia bacterium]
MELSIQQRAIIEFMLAYKNKNGYPPSVREIGKAMGLSSTSSIHRHLKLLEEQGYLKRNAAKPRAIEINYKPEYDENFYAQEELERGSHALNEDFFQVPIVGDIAAGSPIFAEQNIDEILAIPKSLLRNQSDVFGLNVHGDSMIDAGIFDGDLVFIRPQNYATNGDIVAALIDDSATLKRYYKEKTHIRLQPENTLLEPIYVRNVTILGKLIGVYRKVY